jgi:hypothetical protein
MTSAMHICLSPLIIFKQLRDLLQIRNKRFQRNGHVNMWNTGIT